MKTKLETHHRRYWSLTILKSTGQNCEGPLKRSEKWLLIKHLFQLLKVTLFPFFFRVPSPSSEIFLALLSFFGHIKCKLQDICPSWVLKSSLLPIDEICKAPNSHKLFVLQDNGLSVPLSYKHNKCFICLILVISVCQEPHT